MNSLKQDIARIQELVSCAFQRTGEVAALAGSGQPDPAKLQRTLEQTAAQFERTTLELRRLCEKHSPGAGGYGSRPAAPRMETAGYVEQFGYGWLHIQLNTLLPHCRYQTPEWLSDTIRRLLDEYESGGSELPHFNQAMLVIDEHCGIDGRHIFDQDNKGYKAISNAVKGRLIPDDDQYTLALALLSQRSELNVCHITLLDQTDAADFFALHSGDYARNDFYGGVWSCWYPSHTCPIFTLFCCFYPHDFLTGICPWECLCSKDLSDGGIVLPGKKSDYYGEPSDFQKKEAPKLFLRRQRRKNDFGARRNREEVRVVCFSANGT